MTPHIVKCGQQMEAYLQNIQAEGTEFEVRDLSSMFAIDSFASAGFGIEQNTFQDPDNIFRKMAMSLVCAPGYGSSWDSLRMMFIVAFPGRKMTIIKTNYIYIFSRTFQASPHSQSSSETHHVSVRHHREDLR